MFYLHSTRDASKEERVLLKRKNATLSFYMNFWIFNAKNICIYSFSFHYMKETEKIVKYGLFHQLYPSTPQFFFSKNAHHLWFVFTHLTCRINFVRDLTTEVRQLNRSIVPQGFLKDLLTFVRIKHQRFMPRTTTGPFCR